MNDQSRVNTGLSAAIESRSFLFERQMLSEILSFIVEETQSRVGYLHLYDERLAEISLTIWSQHTVSECATVHADHYSLSDAGIWADCIRQRRTIVHEKAPFDLPEGHFPLERHMSGCLYNRQNEIIGIVGVGNRPLPYDAVSQQGFEAALEDAATILIGHRDNKEGPAEPMPGASDAFLVSSAQAIDALMGSDIEEVSQAWVVTSLVLGICDELGIVEDEKMQIGLAAVYHDVGFKALENTIFIDMGLGFAARFALLKQHVHHSVEFAERISLPQPIVATIQQHHERLDGSGYPFGLTEEDIGLPARIVGLADDFEAMMNKEVGLGQGNFQGIIDRIKKDRGVRYDPYVVDALWRFMISERGLAIRSYYNFSGSTLAVD